MESGDEKRDIARSSWQNAVFSEESFGENRALYVYLAYKDVDRFRKGSIHELYCLKDVRRRKTVIMQFATAERRFDIYIYIESSNNQW